VRSGGNLVGVSHNAVRPKLALSDAATALEWYADALGAEIGQRYQAGGQVVFADLVVFGTTVTLKDADNADPVPSPGPILDCVVDDPDGVAARMVAAGGEVVFPVEDQPYGARGGRVRDPFGVQWLLQTPLTMTADDVQRSIDQMT
jgi:PhnB protein